MTKEQAVKRVLELARAEIGYREKASNANLDDKTANAGTGNFTKYARDLDAIPGFYNGAKIGYAWCDCYFDWLLVKAFGAETAKRMLCQPDNSAGAGCYFSALYYRQAGRFFQDPEPGDQIFFTYQAGEVSHTGVVEEVTGSSVTTIEGNTSDGVYRRSYRIGSGQIYGYGRPDWALAATVPEENFGSQTEAEKPKTGKTYTVTLPELRKGDTGTAVERLQTLLIGRGYYCGGISFSGRERPDGDFGPQTEAAVKDVQLAAGLEQNGIVGQETMQELLTK